MDISLEKKQRALRISQALQQFFDQNRGTTDLRSTDAYDILVTKNLIERDRSRGFFFREFLKKLKAAGALGFIPQCRLEGTEWHFRSAGKKVVGSGNLRPLGMPSMAVPDIAEIDDIKKQIAELPRSENKKFTALQRLKRQAYPRAYENWSAMELELLQKAVKLNLNMQELSRLFGRQPSVLEDRLNGQTEPRLNRYKRF